MTMFDAHCRVKGGEAENYASGTAYEETEKVTEEEGGEDLGKDGGEEILILLFKEKVVLLLRTFDFRAQLVAMRHL